MTITHSEEWHDQQIVEAKVKELDERLKVVEEILAERVREIVHTAIDKHRQITVTDAMREAGSQTIRQLREHDNSLEYIAERIFQAMWEARDGRSNSF